jgi:phosphatidylglycerophosphatase A
MIKQLNIFILTMFGIGNSKYAPGTAASFVTCLFYIWFYTLQINIIFLILFVFLIFILSVYVIDYLKSSFSEIDAKEIVIDEFVGQSIPILTVYNFVERNNLNHFIFYTLLCFALFRIFDIYKPYPIKKIDEEMKNGFGVMLDDIIAGLYSIAVLIIIFILLDYA